MSILNLNFFAVKINVLSCRVDKLWIGDINLKEIIELIKQYETIIIHRHVRPDLDAYGSQGGLYEMIKATFPEKKVYRAGEHEENLSYMFRTDALQDSDWEGALAIVTDTANSERIDDQRYLKAEKIIKIDHHINRENYGHVNYIVEEASSTCDLIVNLYEFAKEDGFIMTDEGARLLYGGIVGDTGRFLFPASPVETFKNAAKLVQYNFDRAKLNQSIDEMSLVENQFIGHLFKVVKIENKCVGIVEITNAMQEEFGVTAEFCSRIASAMGKAKEIRAWVVFVEQPDGIIRVNLRSKEIFVNEIAEKYGGGGHKFASGATLSSWEVAAQLSADLVEKSRVGN